MRKILLVVAGLTLWAMSAVAGATARGFQTDDGACPVQKIYVVEFGGEPRRASFRLDLEKWLTKRKFTVVGRPEDADAVLAGELSISSGDKYSYLSFKGAELKTAGGRVLWRGDIDRRTRNAFGWLGRGHIENGAKHIAEKIRAECGGGGGGPGRPRKVKAT